MVWWWTILACDFDVSGYTLAIGVRVLGSFLGGVRGFMGFLLLF